MSIEFLWIIPIVASALIGLIIVLTLNKHQPANHYQKAKERDLTREVADFNQGLNLDSTINSISADSRLHEIEKTIKQVSTVLSTQQEIIEHFKGKDSHLESELEDLKNKLKDLQKEYDITISENYSLRAHIKKIDEKTLNNNAHKPTVVFNSTKKDEKPVYDKKTALYPVYNNKNSHTEMASSTELEDTSEISIDDLSIKEKDKISKKVLGEKPAPSQSNQTSSYLKDIQI